MLNSRIQQRKNPYSVVFVDGDGSETQLREIAKRRHEICMLMCLFTRGHNIQTQGNIYAHAKGVHAHKLMHNHAHRWCLSSAKAPKHNFVKSLRDAPISVCVFNTHKHTRTCTCTRTYTRTRTRHAHAHTHVRTHKHMHRNECSRSKGAMRALTCTYTFTPNTPTTDISISKVPQARHARWCCCAHCSQVTNTSLNSTLW